MQLTPSVTFRDIDSPSTLEEEIAERIDKLETYCGSITACRVLVKLAERHHERGNRYHVRIELTVPGETIVVAHDAGPGGPAQDADLSNPTKEDERDRERRHARVAIREAFDVVRRRLQDFTRRQRGSVKASERQPHGRVAKLFPVGEYGFIEAEDGHEVYFQKSSVLKRAFNRLAVDSVVSFVEEAGEKGPQASTVKLLHPRRTRRSSPAADREPTVQ
jgi:cold shock CspA family protein